MFLIIFSVYILCSGNHKFTSIYIFFSICFNIYLKHKRVLVCTRISESCAAKCQFVPKKFEFKQCSRTFLRGWGRFKDRFLTLGLKGSALQALEV